MSYATRLTAVVLATVVWIAFQVAISWLGLYRASSEAMLDGIQVDDRLVVLHGSPGAPGDPVLHADPRRPTVDCSSHLFLRRLVAREGEEVGVDDGQLVRDGVAASEPYVTRSGGEGQFGPLTVPAGDVFVLSDNRPFGQDSRLYGPLPVEAICGRVVAAVAPGPATLGLLATGMLGLAFLGFWTGGVRRLFRGGRVGLGWLAVVGAGAGLLVSLLTGFPLAFSTVVGLVGLAGWLLPPRPDTFR